MYFPQFLSKWTTGIFTKKNHKKVHYFHEIEESFNFYTKLLQKDDLFITIGAGNNWEIGEQLIKYYKEAWSQTSLLLGNESYRKSEAMRNDLSNQSLVANKLAARLCNQSLVANKLAARLCNQRRKKW